MAVFIPEWAKISGKLIHVKRTLSALGDDHVIRRSFRDNKRAADFFIEHPSKGWLVVAVEDASFEDVDPVQLFESDLRAQFERHLADLQEMARIQIEPGVSVKTLVIMWSCSIEEVRALVMHHLPKYGTRLVSREQFVREGDRIVGALLTQLPEEAVAWFRGRHFAEAEIPAVCTTRRFFNRDNSAKLQRYFLDQEQEWASKLDLELPGEQASTASDMSVRLINGVAGSGKTLIALNRALLLAEIFPAQRLLMLIHNTPVVADVKERLYRVRGGLPKNLEVSTFFSWAYQQRRLVFGSAPKMPRGLLVPNLVKQVRLRWPDIKQSDDQLIAEMDFINEGLLVDETAYLEASRAGRGFALRPKERAEIWAFYQAVTAALQASGLQMWSGLPKEICLADTRVDRLRKYNHILIDEAQFFAPSWFQLVKLSTTPDGQLFLCADPNQGFMKSRLSWKSAGLDVTGRTKRLRRSYRTTRAILEAASSVLAELSDGTDDEYLRPDLQGMEAGVKPVLVYTDSPQDSVERVLAEMESIDAAGALPLSAVLIVFGENVQKFAFHDQLVRRLGSGKVWWFNEKDQKKEPPNGYGKEYVRMAYLDTATGLEGGVVFLVGIEHLFLGDQRLGLSDEERAELREENARKLYMAMTRAGQRLVLVSSQRLPTRLEVLFEISQ